MLVRGLVFLCLLRHILDSLLFIDSQEIRERYINSDFGKMILSGIIQSVEHFFNISAIVQLIMTITAQRNNVFLGIQRNIKKSMAA